MESTIGLYKAECIDTTVFHLGAWKTLKGVEYATAEWIDWYNQRRVHTALSTTPPRPTTIVKPRPESRSSSTTELSTEPGAVQSRGIRRSRHLRA
jgi:hypothetical protein